MPQYGVTMLRHSYAYALIDANTQKEAEKIASSICDELFDFDSTMYEPDYEVVDLEVLSDADIEAVERKVKALPDDEIEVKAVNAKNIPF
jgi:predicted RNase H-like nuclease (RuvC/YqgF family)